MESGLDDLRIDDFSCKIKRNNECYELTYDNDESINGLLDLLMNVPSPKLNINGSIYVHLSESYWFNFERNVTENGLKV